jgi:hypothetical protein
MDGYEPPARIFGVDFSADRERAGEKIRVPEVVVGRPPRGRLPTVVDNEVPRLPGLAVDPGRPPDRRRDAAAGVSRVRPSVSRTREVARTGRASSRLYRSGRYGGV